MHFFGNREAVAGLAPSSKGRRPTAAAVGARATCTAAPDGTAPCIVSRHQLRLEPPGTAIHPLGHRHTSNRSGGRTQTSDNISVDVGCARMPRSVYSKSGDKKI